MTTTPDQPIMTKTGKEAAELDRQGKKGRKCEGIYGVQTETLQQVAEALGVTVDIIDSRLEGLAPLKKLL